MATDRPGAPAEAQAGSAVLDAEPTAVALAWLTELGSILDAGDTGAAAALFAPDGWLVDRLALTWEPHSYRGAAAIGQVLADRVDVTSPGEIELDQAIEPMLVEQGSRRWIQASFWFSTNFGRGRGLVRLIPGAEGDWSRPLVWTLLLDLRKLGGPDVIGTSLRRDGAPEGSNRTAETWLERRELEREFVRSDPAVVVIGAGQSGLAVAARLGQLGVDTLVLERLPRVGDGWRRRYRTLVLHDPLWTNHLPYLPFPDTWPTFIPKDKLADWFEAYASVMELNVWTGSSVSTCSYDPLAEGWQLGITRADSSERTVRPRHIVIATGQSGFPRTPPLPGLESFGGEIWHSSEYVSASGLKGKRVVVVGAGTSAHDICQDLCEEGATVTMVQRSSTYVVSSDTLMQTFWNQGSLRVEDVDHIGSSLPVPVALELAREALPLMLELDGPLLARLREVGFSTNEEQTLAELYLTQGGGYYIEVGASAAIIEGKIKVKSGIAVDRLIPTGVVYSDGTEGAADVVIFATGFGDMRDVAREIVGEEIGQRLNLVWGLDEHNERNWVGGRSGHERLWFMVGNLALVRHHSQTLALQIKAHEDGLIDGYRAVS
jgi:putative flavoprotein involved in K+ transport